MRTAGSGHPLRVGMSDHDRLEPPIAADGLVGADLVEPLALGVPAALAILEEGRGLPAAG